MDEAIQEADQVNANHALDAWARWEDVVLLKKQLEKAKDDLESANRHIDQLLDEIDEKNREIGDLENNVTQLEVEIDRESDQEDWKWNQTRAKTWNSEPKPINRHPNQ